MNTYNKSISEVIQEYNINPKTGLTSSEVIHQQNIYGRNVVIKSSPNLIIKFIKSFKDPLIIILLITAIITYIINPLNWYVALALISLAIIDISLGIYQINRRTNLLNTSSLNKAKVYRDAKIQTIDMVDVVVGDILVLEKGDYVASDARVFESHHLELNQSIITNDPTPALKQTNAIKDTLLDFGDMRNIVFAGTYVVNGRGAAIVFNVGERNIINKLNNTSIEQNTPLHNSFINIFKVMMFIFVLVTLYIFAFELKFGINSIDALVIALDSSIRLLPIGLALVVLITLILYLEKILNYNTINTNIK